MTELDITPSHRATIAAFYHRTRAEWLEWFPAEIVRRVPSEASFLDRNLRDLHRMGFVECTQATKRGAGALSWRVTDAGKARVAL